MPEPGSSDRRTSNLSRIPYSTPGRTDYESFQSQPNVIATGHTSRWSKTASGSAGISRLAFYSNTGPSQVEQASEALINCTKHQLLKLLRILQPDTTEQEATKYTSGANQDAKSSTLRDKTSFRTKGPPTFVELSPDDAKKVFKSGYMAMTQGNVCSALGTHHPCWADDFDDEDRKAYGLPVKEPEPLCKCALSGIVPDY